MAKIHHGGGSCMVVVALWPFLEVGQCCFDVAFYISERKQYFPL
jgi:hypothetical protein